MQAVSSEVHAVGEIPKDPGGVSKGPLVDQVWSTNVSLRVQPQQEISERN